MNDRHPFLSAERDIINFISGLNPAGELVQRNRRLAGLERQHRAAIRAARSDRSAQLRRSVAQLGYAKFAALALFSVVAANLLSQYWAMQQIGFDGWLLLSVSCVFLVLIDRREKDIGRWIVGPILMVEFRPTETAVHDVCRNSRLSRRAIAITLKGQFLR